MIFRLSYITIIFSLISLNLIGQEIIKGKVVSKENKPVSFASIRGNSGQVNFSDSLGMYILKPKYSNELYTFSCVGFQSITFSYKELKNNPKVELVELNYNLNEVIVASNEKITKEKIFGNDKIGIARFFTRYNHQYAIYIPNQNKEKGIIEILSFYLKKAKTGNSAGLFRVRLYSINPITKAPGEDILKSNIILKGDKNSTWLNVDIRNYNIDFPKDGFFMALEVLSKTNYKSETSLDKIKGDKSNFIPLIGLTTTKSESFSWTYSPHPMFEIDRWSKTSGDNFSMKSKILIEK